MSIALYKNSIRKTIGEGHSLMFQMILMMCLLTSPVSSTDQPFTVGMRLLKPIIATQVRGLDFPDAEAGIGHNLVVNPTSENAAVFELTGSRNAVISSTVLESSITLSSPSSGTSITIDGFKVTAPSAINDQGKATIKIGGTAHVDAEAQEGDYSGSATLRVVYL